MGPPIKGREKRTAVTYSFLSHHTDASATELGSDLRVDKGVEDVLKEHGVALNTIDETIWSHAQIDHIRQASLLNWGTKLVVGPGIKEALYSGLPFVKEAPIWQHEFLGRKVEGLRPYEFNLEIGGLKALDYFNDGSFDLLSAPGHALGHLECPGPHHRGHLHLVRRDSVDQLSALWTPSPSDLSKYVHVPSRSCPGAALRARAKSPKPEHRSEAPSLEKEAAAREILPPQTSKVYI
ncbi:hypothetical protein ASPACDRAFT_46460 [Aspergillus aculeatus ATCC 16872]|uniref:Metallo-beta-lactamase domain-containing protein n=1 Tax=Aspergillus aculeatus (strain ATCC 16872 / CBS 172.66 / WB 5094) TaxID=690307 RepID=A0A1L9WLA0_ASPA1|nr:uncharacterized protein ASPACDRAFT_46460 [Aspergillus aculeatus ATCC 16872]OJJ96936.1 hypothetical protein ASPACDRAFT_46460 [Aspergillus aculeatus ATCC 16872]